MNNRNPTDINTVKIKYIPYTFAQVPVAELTQLKEMDIEKKHLITLTQITTCRWKSFNSTRQCLNYFRR